MTMQFRDFVEGGRWLRLPHVLSEDTPAYRGGDGLRVEVVSSISRGNSANSVVLRLSNHLGSHVDAPRHFFDDGRTVDGFAVNDWFFHQPGLIDIPAGDGDVLGVVQVEAGLSQVSDADLLLIRTGFESRRGMSEYWKSSPGL